MVIVLDWGGGAATRGMVGKAASHGCDLNRLAPTVVLTATGSELLLPNNLVFWHLLQTSG